MCAMKATVQIADHAKRALSLVVVAREVRIVSFGGALEYRWNSRRTV